MNFVITEQDTKDINIALSSEAPWKEPCISNFKKRLKIHLLEKQNNQCCYCKKHWHGEFLFVIDIEHILPKSKFKAYMFDPKNLALACKKCNMKIKGSSTSFIKDISIIHNSPYNKKLYRFIHPNLENFYDFITLHTIGFNQHRIIKYTFDNKCDKSLYTYNFFKLKEREIEHLDSSQGLIKKSLNIDVSPNINSEIEQLLTKLT